MPTDRHRGHWNVAASNYWMFLHPTIGCTSNSWITSNYWIMALTDSLVLHSSLQAKTNLQTRVEWLRYINWQIILALQPFRRVLSIAGGQELFCWFLIDWWTIPQSWWSATIPKMVPHYHMDGHPPSKIYQKEVYYRTTIGFCWGMYPYFSY